MTIQNFSNRLLEIRQSGKLTQEELACKIGVTPQAVSRWERGLGLPDAGLLCALANVLGVTLDSLMENKVENLTEAGINEEEKKLLHLILADPILFQAGGGLVEVLVKENENRFCGMQRIREQLANEYGYLLPVVHIVDDIALNPYTYRIFVYDKIMMERTVEQIETFSMDQVYDAIKDICINHYADIINRQIVKTLVDNVRHKYPAIVEGIVPEKITYSDLQKILSVFAGKQKSIHNLAKIIEAAEDQVDAGFSAGTIGEKIVGLF